MPRTVETAEVLHLSAAARTLAARAVLERLNAGTLVLMASDPPADGPDSPSPSDDCGVRLVTLHFAPEAFRCEEGGVGVANPITPATALGSGQAKWFRCFERDDSTAVVDGTVGASDDAESKADLVLNSTGIERGATVSIASFVYVQAG